MKVKRNSIYEGLKKRNKSGEIPTVYRANRKLIAINSPPITLYIQCILMNRLTGFFIDLGKPIPKYVGTKRPSSSAPRYILKRTESLCSHTDL